MFAHQTFVQIAPNTAIFAIIAAVKFALKNTNFLFVTVAKAPLVQVASKPAKFAI